MVSIETWEIVAANGREGSIISSSLCYKDKGIEDKLSQIKSTMLPLSLLLNVLSPCTVIFLILLSAEGNGEESGYF